METPERMALPVVQTAFGASACLPMHIRKSGLVLLCANSGTGFVPMRLLLPHQIYAHDLSKIEGEITAHLVGDYVVVARSMPAPTPGAPDDQP